MKVNENVFNIAFASYLIAITLILLINSAITKYAYLSLIVGKALQQFDVNT